ncbi:hypothetical protein ACT009_06610 [Sphingomonas sp. Tas61C01]|uniref:hypothetical protein n=1 Tax=Sphingomonas sp. Tas61C01 TaxID=3458297 RepID=UPI00403EDC19
MSGRARRWGAIAAVALSGQAIGSGGPSPQPDYVDVHDVAGLTAGRPGVVKAAAPDSLLFADWRGLNGLTLDEGATAALAKPCCGTAGDASYTWTAARRKVPGVAEVYFISTERPGPDYTSTPNCFDDAFITAAATLEDRVRRFGKDGPAVRAWVAAQDAVFDACGKPGVALPALPADAPDWLRADRAYQLAAMALYDGRAEEAATRFAAIGLDRRSPWQPLGLYLEARALQRAARMQPSPARFAAAHAAIARVAAAPSGTYGRGEVERMRQVLAFREDPAGLLARLDRDLGARAPMPDIAVAFRDYMTLSDQTANKPEAADWIRTMRPKDRVAALAHARQRWQAKAQAQAGAAWLVAALSLANPADPGVGDLIAAARRVADRDAAWPSVRYHLLRLTMASAEPAAIRRDADAILARGDLSRADRNLFLAIRTQRAATLAELVRYGLRTPYCEPASKACVDGNGYYGDGLIAPVTGGFVGFGAEARAIIDLLPMGRRVALAGDAAIPAPLRLDIALTGFARAVQVQDDAAIDRLAGLLVTLLPQIADDWRRIAVTRPGADKRFAEFYAMAKIPSLRSDLADLERPMGVERDFSGYWVDWRLVAPRAVSPGLPVPRLAGVTLPAAILGPVEDGEAASDLTCMERCGSGAFPLQLPGFAAATLPQAFAERRRFLTAGTAPSVWDEALAYVRAHPSDPRAAETLYRLIRVARWGANHDHLGRRAFALLHARYPGTRWAEQSPYFYDS